MHLFIGWFLTDTRTRLYRRIAHQSFCAGFSGDRRYALINYIIQQKTRSDTGMKLVIFYSFLNAKRVFKLFRHLKILKNFRLKLQKTAAFTNCVIFYNMRYWRSFIAIKIKCRVQHSKIMKKWLVIFQCFLCWTMLYIRKSTADDIFLSVTIYVDRGAKSRDLLVSQLWQILGGHEETATSHALVPADHFHVDLVLVHLRVLLRHLGLLQVRRAENKIPRYSFHQKLRIDG